MGFSVKLEMITICNFDRQCYDGLNSIFNYQPYSTVFAALVTYYEMLHKSIDIKTVYRVMEGNTYKSSVYPSIQQQLLF